MYRNRVKDKGKKIERLRFAVQAGFTALINGYAAGFAGGKIFTGKTKLVCVPVLNCYSCPGALGSCPIGALSSVAASSKFSVSFYVLGTLALFGVVLGRLVCSFLCPFGLVQDLISKIPVKKIKVPKKLDAAGRIIKYVLLVLFVLLLPAVINNEYSVGQALYCKLICPAGTLGGGIPNLAFDEQLRQLAGALFSWKAAVLVFVLVSSAFVPRFFCRYFCPLGAFYALFNRFSLSRMRVDSEKCTSCKKCERVCPMQVDITGDINSGECIRCQKCKGACPTGAISSDLFNKGAADKKI